jgi:transcription initiation factor TFIIIB Brf1 subunit/transcription initiation factor TFIIB
MHTNVVDEAGVRICEGCGLELSKEVQFNKEWRWHGSDSRHGADPNRVHQRRAEECTIHADVASLALGDKIVEAANRLYVSVTCGHICRGNSRRAIVFACVFHAYKLSGQPQSHDSLIRVFQLTRKIGLKGLKFVNLHAAKSTLVHSPALSLVALIETIMVTFRATRAQMNEVKELYDRVQNRSSRLNRSRPQSVAAGLIYYWLRHRNPESAVSVSLADFTHVVQLSELTIRKVTVEIGHVLALSGTSLAASPAASPGIVVA